MTKFYPKEFYALLSDRGLQYGPYFQGVSDFWMSEAESIAKIQLPQSYINERDTLLFQPSLMDSALQTIAGMILADEKNAASVTVPFSVDKVEWYASLSEMCYVCTQRLDNELYDVSIVNSKGQICVALNRLVIKHLSVKSDKTIPINDFLYEVVWEPKVLLASQKKEIAYGNGQTILLVTKPGLETWSDEIRDIQHSGDIYEIEIGQQTVRINDKKWTVQGDDMASWRDCLTQIPKASMVCYLAAIQPEAVMVDIDSALETKQIIIPMFNMFKALSESDWIHKNMDMYVITNNIVNIHPEEKIQPIGAGLHGFVMSAAKEYPQLAIRGMDVCVKEPVSKQLKAIFEEPPHPSGEFVVIRNGNRYVQGFKKSNLPMATQSPFKLNGVYLIIGGAGGLVLQ